ncbi:MAG TPA: DegT/DnrJ/EryC1/StrS family aminotransferase, partial [Clostridia bacterium]|nr:DegT/DnrJ/EryC1/StrS family aminotransferase [Clostridia bacterium]
YYNECKGYNSRLDELQAALLRVKLRKLDEWNQRRAAIAAIYQAGFPAELGLPFVPDWAEPAWHLYVVRHPQRERFQAELNGLGIGTLIHYPVPPHLSGAYADLGCKAGAFPIAEQFASTVLSVPMGPHLQAAQAGTVVEAVRRAAVACANGPGGGVVPTATSSI